VAACTCTSAASVTKPFPPLPFALSAVLTALALAPFARAVTSSTYFRCTSGPLVHRPTYFPCTRRLLVHAQFPAGCTSTNSRSLCALLARGRAPLRPSPAACVARRHARSSAATPRYVALRRGARAGRRAASPPADAAGVCEWNARNARAKQPRRPRSGTCELSPGCTPRSAVLAVHLRGHAVVMATPSRALTIQHEHRYLTGA